MEDKSSNIFLEIIMVKKIINLSSNGNTMMKKEIFLVIKKLKNA